MSNEITLFKIGQVVITKDQIGAIDRILYRHGHPIYTVKDKEYEEWEIEKYDWAHLPNAALLN